MGIRRYNPTTPGRRGATVSDFAELTPNAKPVKGLMIPKKRKGGRNNQGVEKGDCDVGQGTPD